jgi:hypothetical protein
MVKFLLVRNLAEFQRFHRRLKGRGQLRIKAATWAAPDWATASGPIR